jgi:voltage-gated potassium channel
MAFVASTVKTFRQAHDQALWLIECVSSLIFAIEYVLRLWTCAESRRYRGSRLRYALTFRAIIDLMSFLPFVVETAGGYDLPTTSWIRVFRLFRILKTEKYVSVFESFYRIIWFNRQMLIMALLLDLIIMLTTATLLYYLRPAEVESFESIPDSFFLALLMLTGQGIPEGILPWYTKVMVGFTAIFSVAVFAIPAGMLTWGFEAEAERLIVKEHEKRRRKLEARRRGDAVPDSSSDGSSSYGSDGGVGMGRVDGWADEAWAEYEDVILGDAVNGDTNEAGPHGRPRRPTPEEREDAHRVAEIFRGFDVNQNGTMDVKEVFRMLQHVQRHAGGSGSDGLVPAAAAAGLMPASTAQAEVAELRREVRELGALVRMLAEKQGVTGVHTDPVGE